MSQEDQLKSLGELTQRYIDQRKELIHIEDRLEQMKQEYSVTVEWIESKLSGTEPPPFTMADLQDIKVAEKLVSELIAKRREFAKSAERLRSLGVDVPERAGV